MAGKSLMRAGAAAGRGSDGEEGRGRGGGGRGSRGGGVLSWQGRWEVETSSWRGAHNCRVGQHIITWLAVTNWPVYWRELCGKPVQLELKDGTEMRSFECVRACQCVFLFCFALCLCVCLRARVSVCVRLLGKTIPSFTGVKWSALCVCATTENSPPSRHHHVHETCNVKTEWLVCIHYTHEGCEDFFGLYCVCSLQSLCWLPNIRRFTSSFFNCVCVQSPFFKF